MDIREFYKKYNLPKNSFAKMAHVGKNSLNKYEQGEPLRKDVKARIEKAILVIEKHNHVRPELLFCRSCGFYGRAFTEMEEKYEKRFYELLEEES